jgi:hypothetical protein
MYCNISVWRFCYAPFSQDPLNYHNLYSNRMRMLRKVLYIGKNFKYNHSIGVTHVIYLKRCMLNCGVIDRFDYNIINTKLNAYIRTTKDDFMQKVF